MNSVPILQLIDIKKRFSSPTALNKNRSVQALDGVSISLQANSALGIVGESGSGKSTLGNIAARMLPADSGKVLYSGTDITNFGYRQLKPYRRKIQMIFQDPYSSLDPTLSIEEALYEPLRINRIENPKERIKSILDAVGLGRDALKKYPHEFSGGQRQRIVIARALLLDPELIIADEPVSALDVSIQAQILNLIRDIKERFSVAVIFISHDLAAVRYVCERISVMYRGRIVEEGRADLICSDPKHPYTKLLLYSVPDFSKNRYEIPTGSLAEASDIGCAFYPLCPEHMDRCRQELPSLLKQDGIKVACFKYGMENLNSQN